MLYLNLFFHYKFKFNGELDTWDSQNYWKAGDKINLNEFLVTKAAMEAFKEWLPPARLGKFGQVSPPGENLTYVSHKFWKKNAEDRSAEHKSSALCEGPCLTP